MTQNPTVFIVGVFNLALMLLAAPRLGNADNQKACYLITDQRDWSGYRLGAAEHYLEAATACHTGDHLTVAEIPVRQAGYFIIEACDPAFAITTLHISDILVSITCVKSNYKELRQN
jgi:hypothetical protein